MLKKLLKELLLEEEVTTGISRAAKRGRLFEEELTGDCGAVGALLEEELTGGCGAVGALLEEELTGDCGVVGALLLEEELVTRNSGAGDEVGDDFFFHTKPFPFPFFRGVLDCRVVDIIALSFS